MNTLDTLLLARARYDQGNGLKGYSTDGNGNFCALGALRDVLDTTPVWCWRLEFDAARTALCDQMPEPFIGVSAFNDRSTKAQVLALFDAAINAEAVEADTDAYAFAAA